MNRFQANVFSCAAIPSCLRVGCILRNLSVALLFWGSGRPFSTAQGCVMQTALPLVNTPVCFPASLLSFTAYSPSHDDSLAFTVVKSHLRFCSHSSCTFCTLKNLKGWPWQMRDLKCLMDDTLLLHRKHFVYFILRELDKITSLNVPDSDLCYHESHQLHKAGSTARKQILTSTSMQLCLHLLELQKTI